LADSLLRQVFYNLIDNSLKHGSKVTLIQLGYRQSDSALYLIYSDNGVGVPQEVKDKIFEDGFGTNGATNHGPQLVKKMIEAYGWSIKEVGTPGLGASFEIAIRKNR
jgi:signal transduction histidine kinase